MKDIFATLSRKEIPQKDKKTISELLFRGNPWKTKKSTLMKSSKAKFLILFIGEKPKDWISEKEKGILARMVAALKLDDSDTQILFIKKDQSNKHWQKKIADLKPQVVVALGAVAVNILLQRPERLSQVHGQVFEYSIEGDKRYTCKLVPIFHPDILKINPNMKRTSWIDLQKVLKLVDRDLA